MSRFTFYRFSKGKPGKVYACCAHSRLCLFVQHIELLCIEKAKQSFDHKKEIKNLIKKLMKAKLKAANFKISPRYLVQKQMVHLCVEFSSK